MAAGRPPPAKPWERPGASSDSSSPSPFAPPSPTPSTAAAIGGAANTIDKPNAAQPSPMGGAAMPLRPWERNQGSYGNYGPMTTYNRPYNSVGGYGSYGGFNSGGYGYGSSPYGSNYGGNYGGNLYGGGMYNNRFGGGGYGGYGMPVGGYGGYPPGNPMPPNPDDPYAGGPPRAPSFWQSMLSVLHGAMTFFGRLAILIDENTQAFHFFITALLQLCDRAGILYGELARFVLRILGFRPRSSKARSAAGNRAFAAATDAKQDGGAAIVAAPKDGAWDNVWVNKDSM